MAYFVSILLTLSAWIRAASRRNSASILLAFAFWGWMWFLTWANTENPDLDGYLYFYGSPFATQGVGPGYWLLVQTARIAGVSYGVFLAVCSGFAFGLMAIVSRWYTVRPTLVAVLYFLYPFFFDAIQVRNLIAMSLVILGFGLTFKLTKGGNLAFVLLTILAGTIHVTMLIFLAIWVLSGGLHATISRALAIIGVFLTIAAIIEPRPFRVLGGAIAGQLGADRGQVYFLTDARMGVVMFTVLHLFTIAVLTHSKHVCSGAWNGAADACDWIRPGTRNYTLAAFRFAQSMTIMLPLVALNSNFWRPLRNMWFVYALAFAIGVDGQTSRPGKRPLLLSIAILTVTHVVLLVLPAWDNVVRAILEHNWVLDMVSGIG